MKDQLSCPEWLGIIAIIANLAFAIIFGYWLLLPKLLEEVK